MSVMKIADIIIGTRHRVDMGDLEELAKSIDLQGLLHPVVLTEGHELVCGYRRLVATRDVLKRTEIEVRIVSVTSIVEGEHDENKMRKDFSKTELHAIMEAVERELDKRKPGRPLKNGREFSTIVAKRSNGNKSLTNKEIAAACVPGIGNTTTAREIKLVIDQGAPELRDAMDRNEIAVHPASILAQTPKEEQKVAIALPGAERRQLIAQHEQRQKAARATAKQQKTNANGKAKQPQPARPKFDASKLLNLGTLRNPTREEVGRPPVELATQEHPDHAGMTYDMVWIMENGSVHTRPKDEKEQLDLNHHFAMLWAELRQWRDFLNQYPDSAEKWKRLSVKGRKRFNPDVVDQICDAMNALKAAIICAREAVHEG